MMFRALIALFCVVRFTPAQLLACKPVEGDRILGEHLAAALPEFRALPPETLLGSMPPPGSKRTFRASELASLARRYSIRLDSTADVCFEWPMESLDRGHILQAMRESLPDSGARIDITETSLSLVPRGRLEFPLATLGKPALDTQKDPALWRGDVVYGGDRRYAVWAKVRVTVPCERMIAQEALKAGQPINPQAVVVERGECFPSLDRSGKTAPASLLGMVPARAIAAGSQIRPEFLTRPNDVNRGDAVRVEVQSGAARLALVAQAESGGRSGDFITVRNPSSNKTFRARIKDKGQVVVQTEFAAISQ
jgi:flagella basal body P-ring formation protein FlgA